MNTIEMLSEATRDFRIAEARRLAVQAQAMGGMIEKTISMVRTIQTFLLNEMETAQSAVNDFQTERAKLLAIAEAMEKEKAQGKPAEPITTIVLGGGK